MDGLRTTAVGNSALAHLSGAAGIVGQLAAAYGFRVLPMLVVPSPLK